MHHPAGLAGLVCLSLWLGGLSAAAQAPQEPGARGLPGGMDMGDPTAGLSVIQLAPGLRYVTGRNVSSNTIVLDTPAGAIVTDTSRAPASRAHFDLLRAAGVDKAAYVILTHGHGDHTGGVGLWKGMGAKVVAQDGFASFLAYQRMLSGFFAVRNASQFQFAGQSGAPAGSPPDARLRAQAQDGLNLIVPDLTFGDRLELEAGGVTLQLIHTPGETPDHLTVWVPHLRAAFVGDNFYESFPNMYTLRGTMPRWPLDYISSLEKVLALEPEILVPSHGPAILGKEVIRARLSRMRDAIVYVHEAVLRGMNAGKDVHTLMQEIRLPPELDVGEGYGRISWSVRGMYEGYVGWFTGDPADMFPQGRDSVSGDLVRMAGGPARIAEEAMRLLEDGRPVEALHLTSIGLEAAPGDREVSRARAAALEALLKASANRNEIGWLSQGLAEARRVLE